MKRPLLGYVTIVLGVLILAGGLWIALYDDPPLLLSIVILAALGLPFFLPWHRFHGRFWFLVTLFFPSFCLSIEAPKLIHLYFRMLAGENPFSPVPDLVFVGFLQSNLFVAGTLLLMGYAIRHVAMAPHDPAG